MQVLSYPLQGGLINHLSKEPLRSPIVRASPMSRIKEHIEKTSSAITTGSAASPQCLLVVSSRTSARHREAAAPVIEFPAPSRGHDDPVPHSATPPPPGTGARRPLLAPRAEQAISTAISSVPTAPVTSATPPEAAPLISRRKSVATTGGFDRFEQGRR